MTKSHPFPDEFSPVGSSIFYAIRFAPRDRHSALSLVNAFYQTIRSIPLTCSDTGVASEKLNWWREEINRSRRSEAQHPIAKSLSRIQAEHQLSNAYFEPFFQAINREIGSVALQTDMELQNHCRETGGFFADMIALIGSATVEQREYAKELGAFIRMVEIIRDLGADLRRGRCFIPVNSTQIHHLSATQLLRATDDTGLQKLLTPIIKSAVQQYQNASHAISIRKGLGPVLALAALAEKLLDTIHADCYHNLLQQRISLTPLHKLWISWRCQRSLH